MFRQIQRSFLSMVGLLALVAAPALAQATMTVNPASLTFNVPVGPNFSSAQNVTVTVANTAGGAVGTFSAVSVGVSGSWLAIASNTARTGNSTSYSITVNPGNLAAGTYSTSAFIVHDLGGTRQLDVTMNVGTGTGGSTLTATPSSLNFFTAVNGTSQQGLQIANLGASTQFSVSSNQNWLSTSPALGTVLTSPTTITVIVNAAFLGGATSGSGTLTLTPLGGGTATFVPVTISVSSANQYQVNPSAFNFNYVASSGAAAPTANLNLTATAAGQTAYNAPTIDYISGAQTGWLSVSPNTAGTTTSNPGVNLTVIANPTGLAVGSYSARINITGAVANSPVQIPVSLTVTGSGSLISTPSSVNFVAQPGANPAGQSISISANTGGSVAFVPTIVYTNPPNPTVAWLQVGNAGVNLNTPSSLSVNAISTNGVQTLALGEYNAVVRLTLSGTAFTQDVPVKLTVTNNAVFTVSTNSMTFTGAAGTTPAAQTFTLQLTPPSGQFFVQFTASAGTPTNILPLISPSQGLLSAGPTTITLNPSFVGVSAGSYAGTLTVGTTVSGAINPTQTINMTFNVTGSGGGTGSGPSDFVFPNSLQFAAVNGSTTSISQLLPLVSTGAALNWTLTPTVSWLSVSPTSGTTPATPTVTVNPTGLASNSTLFGQLTIGGTGTVRDGTGVLVRLDTNNSPQTTVNPSALTFSYVIGSGVQPSGQSIAIASTTGATLTYTAAATSNGNWLQVSPTSGVTNGTNMIVTLNTAALLSLNTAGTYDGNIQITTSGGVNNTINFPVKLVLSSTGNTGGTTLNTLVIAPSSMSFYTQAGVNPLQQNILLINPSLAASFTATAVAANGGNWLQIQVNPSGIITVAPAAAGLSPGTYSGTVTVTSSQLPAGSATITISLTVTPTVAVVPIPQGMIFSWPGGSASLPSAQSLTLTTTNGSAVPFTVNTSTTSGGGWLSVITGGSNTAPTSISVTANPSGLPAGVYTGTITISTSGTANPTQTVDVRLIVTGAGGGTGAFQFNPTALRFFAQPNGQQPPNQQVSVTTTGPVTNYLVTTQVTTPSGGAWLQAGPSSGTTPGSISVGVNPFGLSNGTYSGTVTVSGNNQSSSFTVELVITNNPLVVTSTRSIVFNHQAGISLPGPRTVAVTTSNNQALSYTASVSSANSAWLQVTQPNSATPGVFGVSLVPSAVNALVANTTYQATITLSANGADNSPLQIPVTLNLSGNPQLLLSSNSPMTFNAAFNGAPPPAQSVTVSSTSTALNVTVQSVTTSAGNWLSATLNTAVTPSTLTVTTASGGLSTGVYNGTVTVTSTTGVGTSSTVTIPVVLNVSSQPLLNVTPRELNFGGAGTGTQQQSLNVTNTLGTASYSVSSSVATPFGGNWLQVNASQSTGVTPANVQISVVPVGLADGTYFGTVTVSATGVANSPIVIPVTLTVNNATALFVSPTDVTFGLQQGGLLPQAQAVSVTSQISTAFSVTVQPGAGTVSANWLDVSPSSGLTNAILTVRPNSAAATLPPGRYIAVVTVSGTGSPNTSQFNVTLNVAPSITLSAAPTSLNFTGRERSTLNPTQQSLTVNAVGGSANLVATAISNGGGTWLSVSPTSGATPATFNVNVNVGTLTQGSYTGTIAVALANAATTPVLQIPVSFVVERAVQPNITSIANAASFQPGALAPGLIVSLFGAGLGPDVGLGVSLVNGRVSRNAGGVRVLFDGIEAPLLFVRGDQINCVVPYQMAGRAQATVQVDNNGVLSNPITPRIADTAPAIFNIGGTQAAMLNQNNSVNGAANPADRGSIGVLYMTGEGALTPPGVDGEVTSTVKRPIAPVTIRVGGVDVTNIPFVGAAPGLVQGVLQINFVLPASAPVGPSIPIEVTIGGQRTQANLTISVR